MGVGVGVGDTVIVGVMVGTFVMVGAGVSVGAVVGEIVIVTVGVTVGAGKKGWAGMERSISPFPRMASKVAPRRTTARCDRIQIHRCGPAGRAQ